MPSTIDISGVSQKAFRRRIERLLSEQFVPAEVSKDFWTRFPIEPFGGSSSRPLVLSDLSTMVRHFKASDAHHWRTAVRKVQPFFVALLRTDRDIQHIEWLSAVSKASDMRLNVCSNALDFGELTLCLQSAMNWLQPDIITEARFIEIDNRFWVQFGDGLSGTWSWADLQLESLASRAIPESISPSSSGSSVEHLLRDGSTYDIDAGVLRAFFDAKYKANLEFEAERHRLSFGERVRHIRRSRGLTQTELGLKSSLDQAVISRIEQGEVRPRIDTLDRIASSLDISVGELLGD